LLLVSGLIGFSVVGCGSGTPRIQNPPTSNAGPNQTVAVGALVQLDASKSSDLDGDTLTFSWALTSAPPGSKAQLSGASAAKATFRPDVAGTYVAVVSVGDGLFWSEAHTNIIAISANPPPTANAGSNQTVATGSVVQLDGSSSSDLDGDKLAYTWSLMVTPAGSKASLSNTGIANPTFTADAPGTYVAQLAVSDGTSTASAQVTITANSIPVANAGPNQTVATGVTVQLDGSKSSDTDGDKLTYSWSLASVPSGSKATLASSTMVNPTFVADVTGNYIAQLTVSDGIFSNVSTVSVAAGISGQTPLLATGTPTFWSSNNTLFVLFPIINDGSGIASSAQLTSVALSSQGATVATVTKPTSFPFALGDIPANALAFADTSFDGTSLNSGNHYLVTVSGTYQVNGTSSNFMLTGDVIYGTTSVFDLPPNAVNLTVSTDSAHAASGTITADSGGTITATGTDGTVFTLTVPANALLTDEAVTMTPISSAADFLHGGRRAFRRYHPVFRAPGCWAEFHRQPQRHGNAQRNPNWPCWYLQLYVYRYEQRSSPRRRIPTPLCSNTKLYPRRAPVNRSGTYTVSTATLVNGAAINTCTVSFTET
jgi:hypothetical protein